MFTGIIETIGEVVSTEKRNENLLITISASISKELKIDQSVSHNGACLTVISQDENMHTVEAVAETLKKTNLRMLQAGSYVNIERAMPANGRFDGHIVQGHVDQTATCIGRDDENGSIKFWFSVNPADDNLLVEKGSICIDGVSLTLVNVEIEKFSVVVIPFTLSHTCFQFFEKGYVANLEFDILGKYVQKALSAQKHKFGGGH